VTGTETGKLVEVVNADGIKVDTERFTRGDWTALAWEAAARKLLEYPDHKVVVKSIRRSYKS